MGTAKENILQRVKQALASPVPLPFDDIQEEQELFEQPAESLAETFAAAFTGIQGNFVYCEKASQLPLLVKRLIEAKKWDKVYCENPAWKPFMQAAGFPLTTDLAACDVSITDCELLVARTGTIVLGSAQVQGRTASVYAPIHVCIAYTSQLVFDVTDALKHLQLKYGNELPSFLSFASGPSRTADIEKTLVTGVHGPKEVFCFLVEDRNQ